MSNGRLQTSTGPRVSQERALKVLHVDTERGWRGGERQLLWLAQGLAKRGDASVIAARAHEPLATRAREAGFSVLELRPLFAADPFAAWQLRTVIERQGIDVVHAHTSHAVSLAAVAMLGLRVPIVVARRVDFPLHANMGTRWKYGRAREIIAVSRAVADIVATAGLGVPVTVIHDATDVARVAAPADATTLASLGVPAGAPLVVQVAQLVPHKDPLTFVRAIAVAQRHVPALHALLVGDGPLRGDVEREVAEQGLSRVLHVVGYRTDADALLAAADVVTLSSREEGMGSVLLDAFVFGRPVAATRAGGIPEIVHECETGLLVSAGADDALGRAIALLLTDHALANRLGTTARASAQAFSIDAITTKTRDVYLRVLGR